MSQEELQKKYDRFLDLVRRMRGYQKEYFKYRSSQDLDRAKALERQVDSIVKDAVKESQSKQNSLF